MSKKELNQPLKTALDELKVYFELQIKLNKAVYAKKAEEFSSQLILILILAGIMAFFLLFLSFGFVQWYTEKYGSEWIGYMITAGFYLLLTFFIYLFRNSFIYKPLRKNVNKVLIEGETELPAGSTLNDKTFLDRYIKVISDKVVKQEVILKRSFANLTSIINFENIAKQLLTDMYHSFITTTNIVKTIYHFVSKLKSKKRGKYREPDKLKK